MLSRLFDAALRSLDWFGRTREAWEAVPWLWRFFWFALGPGAIVIGSYQVELPLAGKVLFFVLLTSLWVWTAYGFTLWRERRARHVAAPFDAASNGPTMTVGEAVNYLAHQSLWGYDKIPQMAYRELDSALEEGSIRSWGQLCLTPFHEVDGATMNGTLKLSGVTKELTESDWKDMRLIPRWIMNLDLPNSMYPHLAWWRNKDCKQVFGHIKVNRREIEEKWPPRR